MKKIKAVICIFECNAEILSASFQTDFRLGIQAILIGQEGTSGTVKTGKEVVT